MLYSFRTENKSLIGIYIATELSNMAHLGGYMFAAFIILHTFTQPFGILNLTKTFFATLGLVQVSKFMGSMHHYLWLINRESKFYPGTFYIKGRAISWIRDRTPSGIGTINRAYLDINFPYCSTYYERNRIDTNPSVMSA